MTADEIIKQDDQLISEEVARAIEDGELIAYFQPTVDITDNRITGFESLVRWEQNGDVIPAKLFIPSLRRTDTILGLDWFMAEATCEFYERHPGKAWLLSVNFSSWHFHEKDFVGKLQATLEWHGVPREAFAIELAEPLLLEDKELSVPWVRAVHDAGFNIAIDNLGSTDASYDSMRDVAASYLKVDRDFLVRNLATEAGRERLFELFQQAQASGIRTIALGVETKTQVDYLRKMGCDEAQGFFYQRPRPAAAYDALG